MDIDIKDTVSNNYSNDNELSELTQTSEVNSFILTTSNKSQNRPSPLWQYFKYDPKNPNSPIFPKLKKYQTQLSFISIDSWPKQQKDEHDNVLIKWIISDQQSF
ncbi:6157_t:CDS:2, partial [Gigaspora margarita]